MGKKKRNGRARKKKQSAPRSIKQSFARIGSGTWALIGAAVAFLGAYAVVRPHVSVEPYIPLNPVDPYSTQFTIKNESSVFAAREIESVCWPRKMASTNGFSVLSIAPLQKMKRTIPLLEAGASSTIDCPPVIGGIGSYSGEVSNAELEIDVSYRQTLWPLVKRERYPFTAMKDVSKGVHWLHISADEEKPILPNQ